MDRPVKEVYAFDFDGTMTTHDTMLLFLRHSFGTPRVIAAMLLLSPLLVLMKMHFYPNWKVKQRLLSLFLKGMSVDEFESRCRRFAQSCPHVIRKAAVAEVKNALSRGFRVVVVSASVPAWVRPFFLQPDGTLPDGLTVIGTELEEWNGLLTGRLSSINCYGSEKVRRLLNILPDRASYRLTAFGDSRGDRELLSFADVAHYKPFRD